MESETRFQRMIRWFQDHRFFSLVLFVCAALIAAGTVTGAIDNIVSFSKKYFSFSRTAIVQIKPEQVIPIPRSGFGYHYFGELPRLGLSKPDTLDRNNNSRLVLLEDGRPLDPAHSGHKDIEDIGRGRYSHWLDDHNREYLYFSTSDNSDPRSNGRVYALAVPNRREAPVTIDPGAIRKVFGEDTNSAGYRYRGAGLRLSPADSKHQPNISRLRLLEDGKRLGPAHSPPREVSDIGQGRYSHWHDGQAAWLFFSTSDNSDPRTNGRVYAITTDEE